MKPEEILVNRIVIYTSQVKITDIYKMSKPILLQCSIHQRTFPQNAFNTTTANNPSVTRASKEYCRFHDSRSPAPSRPQLTLISPPSLHLAHPGKLLKLTHINGGKLRARQRPHGGFHRRHQAAYKSQCAAGQQVWLSLLRRLEGQAEQVVSLEQILAVDDSAGNGGEVHASEGVRGTHVPAYGEDFGVLKPNVLCIELEERDGVFIADGASVPVFWDAFMAGGVDEGSVGTADGEERFQDFFVEDTFWVVYGFIAHEAIDKLGAVSG
jgi:hypothetical protein